MGGVNHPPGWLVRLLTARIGGSPVGRTILGDLNEEFAERVQLDPRAARRWYRREALSIFLRRAPVAPRTFNQAIVPTGDSLMRRVLTDLRYAVRSLVKQPRFTALAMVTLALGVGASTAIFSVVNGVLLKPLPYRDADRIVNVWSHAPKLGYDQFPLSPDIYFLFERDNSVFESMALFQRTRGNLLLDGTPEVVETIRSTHTYFATLGIEPQQGRTFTAQEDRPGGPNVMVISHRAWRDRLGGDPAAVGRRVRLNAAETEIIGIAPPVIDERGSPDFFLPARYNREQPVQGNFGSNATARLKPGVTAEAATTQLTSLVPRILDSTSTPNYRAFLADGAYSPRVNLAKTDLVGDVDRPLWILLGTVGILLLIACANVANLFLVRAEGRHLEIAVRMAMGAPRGALVRGMMAEAVVLACAGSALGLAVVAAGLPALLTLAPLSIPRLDSVTLDVTVAAFAVGVTLIAALLFGLWPALRYTRPRSLTGLREASRGGSHSAARHRARHALVVVQAALAVILLVGSGLLARSFARLHAIDPGFDAEDVMTFRISLPASQYRDTAAVRSFSDGLLERLRAIPGVTHAGATTTLPVLRASPGTAYRFDGKPVVPGVLPPMVHYKIVVGDYFGAMGIPVTRGRSFDSRDLAADATTVIVNEALAREHWPGEDPLGKRMRLGGDADPLPPWVTVVGVVGTERQDGLRRPERGLLYYARSELSSNDSIAVLDYTVKGAGITGRADELRRAVWAGDAGLPVAAIQPMATILEESIVDFTFTMVTLGIAAGMALLLGAIGMYGVLSYAVSMRTREIGVRLALGAQPGEVLRSVVLRGTAVGAIGLVIGLGGAAALSGLMEELLFETEPLDPTTFAVMSVALLVVAALASYLPARRAAHVSPLESMKSEL